MLIGLLTRSFFDFYGVPRQETYVCAACGKIAHPPSDEIDHFNPNTAYIEYVDDREEPIVICLECLERGDWEDSVKSKKGVDSRVDIRSPSGWKILGVSFPSHSAWTRLWDFGYEVKPGLILEQWLFILRLTTVLAGTILVLVGVTLFAGISGAIFVSTAAGIAWIETAIQLYQAWGTFLIARPALILAGLGLAYFSHLYEYNRPIEPQAVDLGEARPQWHYLAVSAVTGFIGGLGWGLVDSGLLPPFVLPGAVVAWSAGAFGLVYFLHYTLLEDRWSYGLRVRSAFWKSPVQYAVGLKLYDGVIGLPSPDAVASIIAIIPPVVGMLYVGRRYIAFTESWLSFQQTVYHATCWRPFSRSSAHDGIWQSPNPRPFEDHQPHDEKSRMGVVSTETQDDRIEHLEAELNRLTKELEEARASDSTQTESETGSEPEDLLPQLLRIKANLDRALGADGEVREGVEMIDRQIETVLEREGIETIDTSGSVDPTKHKVVGTVDSSEHEPGEIVDVYRPGFRRGDRILQEAYVVVAADPDSNGASDELDRYENGESASDNHDGGRRDS